MKELLAEDCSTKYKHPLCSTCKNYHPQHDDYFPLFDCQLHIYKTRRLNEKTNTDRRNKKNGVSKED